MEPSLPRRANLLGVQVSITDYAEATQQVLAAAHARRSLCVSAAAVHAITLGHLDPDFGAVLNALDLVVPDGQPVRWGLAATRAAYLRDRVYGPTLMLRVCEAAANAGLPVFLFGSSEAALASLRAALGTRLPSLRIAGVKASRFREASPEEQREDARSVVDSGARIAFVGLGCPRQEWWMFHQRERLPMPLLGVGAAFELLAGTRSMAPALLQAAGLEWAFRLVQEPRRLWRRYLGLNPLYVALLGRQLAQPSRFPSPTDVTNARARPCPG